MAAVRPTDAVLAAFGVHGAPVPLPGGQGRSWRVGAVVLKPLDMDAAALAWQADVLASVDGSPDFRVAPPLPATDGRRVVDGWTAWRWEPGRHRPHRWAEIVEVGESFHAALADVPAPEPLWARTDPWAVADRIAWGEQPGPDLLDALVPSAAPSQLIHGDLTGNVLFDDVAPPLVIDLSPYWRPVGFAAAIVVADALVHGGAGPDVVDLLDRYPDGAQLLLRALVFRSATDQIVRSSVPPGAYGPAFALALRRLGR